MGMQIWIPLVKIELKLVESCEVLKYKNELRDDALFTLN